MTLLNKDEVFYYSNVARTSINTGTASQKINDVERATFLRYLSMELYYAMQDDAINYSSTAEFSISTAYSTNALVKSNGIVYKATQGSTGKIPVMDSPYWTEADKFTNDCLQALWVEIRRWLCLSILRTVMPAVAVQLDDKGLVERNGQDFQAASIRKYDIFMQGINEDINLCWANFKEWLDNRTTCDFSAYLLPCISSEIRTPVSGKRIPIIF